MASAKFDIILEEGSTWQKQILWTDAANNPISLVGYFVRLGIVKDYDDASPTIFLNSDEVNTNGSTITVAELTGKIDIKISASDVDAALTGGFRKGFWDIEVVPYVSGTRKVPTVGNWSDTGIDAVNPANNNHMTITANGANAAFNSYQANDYLVLRDGTNSTNDGMYKVLSSTSTTINFTSAGAIDAGSNNSMSIFQPDETSALRIIGGKVRTSQSATTRRSVDFA